MRFREAVRMVEDGGWYFVRAVGSHHHFKHPTKPGKVTIPNHNGKDIDPITVKSIRKQAGLK
ncbi:Predicted RNA binding protein YcfA, dsRBD-like fold, HicA-like mRNA interferase family [Eubacterium aggregans]|uniref:Predicted RNA binding protein YcfA, dsRBD-like fold, HicA-like mRNA interferase family n=1 Tax=Eubacterium aggregans TaxID=81409 RepID=A0A1H3YTI5_9FIRM|nr:type II toxin-antitoxin system HicA family toxin [Eubacterium aggregans]SEA14856.1 Predicted RNA binding protein YcfA, dsRBD-like fold, HicA-like mRNA interferase family [Eubacterium aggregans]